MNLLYGISEVKKKHFQKKLCGLLCRDKVVYAVLYFSIDYAQVCSSSKCYLNVHRFFLYSNFQKLYYRNIFQKL